MPSYRSRKYFKRKSYRRLGKIKYRARRGYKRYKLKKAGMQRIKTTRWPTRNPYGDRLFYKPRFVYGTTFTIASGTSFVNTNLNFNSMAAIAALAGDAPSLTELGLAYQKYRIRGLKIKMTFWPDSTAPPLVGYTNAAGLSAQLIASPSISTLPEARWSKYKVMSNPGAGAKPTVLISYYSVNKVYGPDEVVGNDIGFIAATASSPAAWVAPLVTVPCQFGAFTMSGLNATADINVVVKMEITPYLQMFNKTTDLN
jgi:hypothetical protein